jgi:hypothetical protein
MIPGLGIKELDLDYRAFVSLQTLHLSENALALLPESFGDLANLVTLWLDSNDLTSLPASFGGLENLITLSLDENALTSLPESIGDLSSLVTFRLRDPSKALESLPESFGDLSSLEYRPEPAFKFITVAKHDKSSQLDSKQHQSDPEAA